MDESNQREKTRDNESHNASKQHVVDPRSERANRLRDFEELHSHYSRSFLVSQFDNDEGRKMRDWNEEFQGLVAKLRSSKRENDLKDVCVKMSHFVRDFVEIAKLEAQKLVLEMCSSKIEKRTKSTKLNSMAKGAYYPTDNKIVFCSFRDRTGEYLGTRNAMKIAGHELRYLNQIYEANLSELHIPFLCIFDWCGFRLMVQPLLSLDENSLIYGSMDMKKSIINKDRHFEKLMENVAKTLNLEKHTCVLRDSNNNVISQEVMYTCADIEGHLNPKDGRYYVVDVARLFPPEDIEKRPEQSGKEHSGIIPSYYLIQHLRPELVRQWKEPLNSDSFSPFAQVEDKIIREEHESRISDCTYYLKKFVIPEFAKSLRNKYADSNIEKLRYLTSEHLIFSLHEAGINIRFLGLVKYHLELSLTSDDTSLCRNDTNRNNNNNNLQVAGHSKSCKQLRALILLEMISRVIKDYFIDGMRRNMKESEVFSVRPALKTATEIYNTMLTDATFWTSVGSSSGPSVKKLILAKFGSWALNDEEKQTTMNIAPVDVKRLVSRLEQLVGVKLRPRVKEELCYFFNRRVNIVTDPIAVEDFEICDVRVKRLPFTYYTEAISDFFEAENATERNKARRFLERAISNFERSGLNYFFASAKEHLTIAMNMWGDALREYGMSIELDSNCDDAVNENAIRIKLASFYFGIALDKFEKTKDTERIFGLAEHCTLRLFKLNKQLENIMKLKSDGLRDRSTLVDPLTLLKTIFKENYCGRIETLQSFTSEDVGVLVRCGSILYRVALEAKNSPEYEKLIQASGKCFLQSMEIEPTLFSSYPLWFRNAREEICHLLYINKKNQRPNQPTKITKFNSAWTPQLSLKTFVQLVQNTSLSSLLLDGTQVDTRVFERLSSLSEHFQYLKEFVLLRCDTMTSEDVKETISRSTELRLIFIRHCAKVDSKKFFNFSVFGRVVDVFVDFVRVSSYHQNSGVENLSTISVFDRPIQQFLPEEDQILLSFFEHLKALNRWLRRCRPEKCPNFVVNGKSIMLNSECVSPRQYWEKFFAWACSLLGYNSVQESSVIVLSDPKNIPNWTRHKHEIYETIFNFYLHLVQDHSSETFQDGNLTFFSSARKMLTLGKKFDLLLRPEEWRRNSDLIAFIETRGSIRGLEGSDSNDDD